MEVVASLSQGLTAAAQCSLFTHKSVPVIFEPPCRIFALQSMVGRFGTDLCMYSKANSQLYVFTATFYIRKVM